MHTIEVEGPRLDPQAGAAVLACVRFHHSKRKENDS
jgi:hypothetical protein